MDSEKSGTTTEEDTLTPCGKNGFLYVGCCTDSCGSPYYDDGDHRVGHECCDTVTREYRALLAEVRESRKRIAELERVTCNGCADRGAP